MDGTRFDDLTRFLAERRSRRSVVKAMAGAIAASIASVGTAIGAPRCKRVNQACQTTADCCPGPNANGNVYCAPSGNKKLCKACPAESPTACNGGCVATSDDDNNCGACGTVCFGGSTCVNGSCQCPAGQHRCADGSCQECCNDDHCDYLGSTVGPICCEGTCVGSRFNVNNCGACGNVCPSDQICSTANCQCAEFGAHVGPDGTCTCIGTDCSTSDQCCESHICFLGACEHCGATGQECHDFVGGPADHRCCSGVCDPTTITCL
jgi:hypothetical protein